MLIQDQDLKQHLQHNPLSFYVLAGPDTYAIEKENYLIKKTFQAKHTDTERKCFHVLADSDWQEVQDELYSYDLFSDKLILDIRYEKKTMDARGKKVFLQFLDNPARDKLIILRCPNIPVKQLQWLSTKAEVAVISAYPPNPQQMKTWITQQLKKQNYQFQPALVDLILDHVQGNMLACSQSLKKIIMTEPAGSLLDEDEIRQQLFNHSEYQLYELSDLMLQGEPLKALKVLKQRLESDESYLLLWLMAREFRLVLQLKFKMRQGLSFQAACEQLKIWRQKTRFYQKATERLSEHVLEMLLRMALDADIAIKTSQAMQAKHLMTDMLILFSSGETRCLA